MGAERAAPVKGFFPTARERSREPAPGVLSALLGSLRLPALGRFCSADPGDFTLPGAKFLSVESPYHFTGVLMVGSDFKFEKHSCI